jgi:uncharacterized integral membrane protein
MKFTTWLIGVPVAALTIFLAVANRHEVLFSLDPFSQSAPVLSVGLPLYLLLFAMFVLGVLIGGSSAWIGQGRWRKKARRQTKKNTHLQRDLARQRETSEGDVKAIEDQS